LRIEDTDRTRSTEEAIQAIVSSLRWLGLDWDEGPELDGAYGPYRQTERIELYQNFAQELLAKKKAYPCFCTPEELKRRREEALAGGKPPRYDGRCRNLSPEERESLEREGRLSALRFAVPKSGTTVVSDLIRGKVRFENEEIGDFILMRTGGTPTYNLAVVVDDIAMEITLVLRGEDHLSNTPKQLLLYQALNKTPPRFAHLPLILGPDRTPLSKRHGAVAIESYRENGFLPEAMINYLALLGWSFDEKTTIFSRQELIERFSLARVSKNPAVFDLAKLEWMNGYYIRELSVEDLAERLLPFAQKAGLVGSEVTDETRELFKKIAAVTRERMKLLSEFVFLADFFFKEEVEFDSKSVEKFLQANEGSRILELAYRSLESVEDFNHEVIEKALRETCDREGFKARQFLQPVRVAVTGRSVSPPLFETLEILGKERSLRRVSRALEIL
jgi:glutamyl-tRNA synthetase